MCTISLIHILCFFFNDTATTEIYTLSLHDALPIFRELFKVANELPWIKLTVCCREGDWNNVSDAYLNYLNERISIIHKSGDRKSTRLNSSHANISYAVFCLKKKKNK